MDSEMIDLLEKAMKDQLNGLDSKTPEEQRSSIDEIVKLNSVMLSQKKHNEEEEEKHKAELTYEESDAEFRARQFEADQAFREKQLAIEAENQRIQIREQRKDRWVKVGITIAELGLVAWSVIKSFTFEETGSINSQTGKKILSWISPKRR